jgi:ribokinase
MRVINFGSLNIDHVYSVERFVQSGETLASSDYQQFFGGKGLNQSIALARAGVQVMHAGSVGSDGHNLISTLADNGVDVSLVNEVDGASGHAVIQVDKTGENCIMLFGGANQRTQEQSIFHALDQAQKGDILLLQNEINHLPLIIESASDRKIPIVFNPAPMSDAVLNYPLDKVDYLIFNQTEGEALASQRGTDNILHRLRQEYHRCKLVLTLGSEGVIYQHGEQKIRVDAVPTQAVDTTAAGDTFIGYFLAALSSGGDIDRCLQVACKASSICIQTAGAANSIPYREQLGLIF